MLKYTVSVLFFNDTLMYTVLFFKDTLKYTVLFFKDTLKCVAVQETAGSEQ